MELPAILEGEDKSSLLGNRIRKNYRHVRKWARRTETNAFRIYDREIGRYPLAIDFYDGRFCVQVFSREWEEEALRTEAAQVLKTLFGAREEDLFWKTRIKRGKREQYEKLDSLEEFFEVLEYGARFRVNLTDYLDTGLFLDHRETRQLVAKHCAGKSLLNLFAYTCAFSVHAARAGASATKSVDLSNTYLDWGRENFRLNELSGPHTFVRADCLQYLDEMIKQREKYDVIVIDPPTLSRSKKMKQMFDVQVDYGGLISRALRLLDKGGLIFFSTNSRHFVFDEGPFNDCEVRLMKTLPVDFHDPKIHRCWRIQVKGAASVCR